VLLPKFSLDVLGQTKGADPCVERSPHCPHLSSPSLGRFCSVLIGRSVVATIFLPTAHSEAKPDVIAAPHSLQSAAERQRVSDCDARGYLPHRRTDRSDTPSSFAIARQERACARSAAILRASTTTRGRPGRLPLDFAFRNPASPALRSGCVPVRRPSPSFDPPKDGGRIVSNSKGPISLAENRTLTLRTTNQLPRTSSNRDSSLDEWFLASFPLQNGRTFLL
jgi:hypothetical protein